MLTKDQILKADDLKTRTLSVPEWGGEVTIREMTGAVRDKFEAETYRKNGADYQVVMTDLRARMCAACIIDADGERVFDDADIRDLSQKSAKALDRVFAACQELNGLTGDEIKDLAKNSGAVPDGVSVSS